MNAPTQTEHVSVFSRFWRVIDERLGLNELRYQIPEHGNTLPYTLGGITAFGMLILGITGFVMTQFYSPDPNMANSSVRYIMNDVPLGSLVRGIHFWAAQAVVVSVSLHLIRVFVTGAFKKPREVNWYIGTALLATTIGFVATGSILKWDQEGFEALDHFTVIFSGLGPIGAPIMADFAPAPVLERLYPIHVMLLPVVLLILLGGHFLYIRHFGISPLPWAKRTSETSPEKTKPFWTHLVHITEYGLVLLVIVAVLAVLFPPIIGPEPIAGVEVTKPMWPFLATYATESLFGIQYLFLASIIVFVPILLIPLVDLGEERDPRRRKAIVIAFFIGLAIFLAFMLYGLLSAPKAHIGG